MVRPPGAGSAAPEPIDEVTLRGCKQCGAPLLDAFDLAVGRCAKCDAISKGRPLDAQTVRMDHRALEREALVAARLVPPPMPVSSPGVDMPTQPGIPSAALLAMLPSEETLVPEALPPPAPPADPAEPAFASDSGEASAPREPAPAAASGLVEAIPAHPDLLNEGATPLGPEDIRRRPQLATYDRGVKSANRPRRHVPWLGILAALVIGAGGGMVLVFKPQLTRMAAPKPPPPVLPAIARSLASWGVQPSGSAAEHLERGRALLREDADASYLAAEQELKAALVLDPHDLRTAALYLEAFAAGRGEWAPRAETEAAVELADALVDARPKASFSHRANAAVLLAAGETELARVSAETAFRLGKPEEQPEVLVLWGRTYLESSPPIALEKFEAALQGSAELRRALFEKAVALERSGRTADAVAAYEKRLALDPGHRESLFALARIPLELRDEAAARKAAERFEAQRPDLVEARLLAGWLALAEGDFGAVEAALRAATARAEKLDPRASARYLTLSAAFALANGQARVAAQQAAKALQAHPRDPAAHFQALLAALATGDAEAARAHLTACEKRLDDPARFQEYLGRVELVAGKLDESVAAFRKAADLAPQRLAPRFAAATVLLRKGDENGAWRALREALDLDPRALARVRLPAGPFHETPAELLRAAAEALEQVRGDAKPLADIYRVIVGYHRGETDQAVRQLDKALATDATSLPALLYRAQIELDRKQPARALKFAKRAVAAEMQSPVAAYLAGRALEGLKKTEEARATYRKVGEQHPTFLPATLRLGVIAAAANQRDEARARLEAVVAAQPENLEARQALLSL